MQEVKATYASALERMKEFDDFKFTPLPPRCFF